MTKNRSKTRQLIEEATVDAHDEEEQEIGFLTMMQEAMEFPFKALVVGEEVDVTGIDLEDGHRGIMAMCKRRGRKYSVNVTSLHWCGKRPPGAEWIEAYQAWIA